MKIQRMPASRVDCTCGRLGYEDGRHVDPCPNFKAHRATCKQCQGRVALRRASSSVLTMFLALPDVATPATGDE